MLLVPVNKSFIPVLTAIHKESFDFPWNEKDFDEVLTLHTTYGWVSEQGFLLCSAVGREAEILTIAVAFNARRQGVGTALLNKLFAFAQKNNITRILAEVSVENEKAISLYLKNGFQITGRRKEYYKTKTGRVDALCIEKIIDNE